MKLIYRLTRNEWGQLVELLQPNGSYQLIAFCARPQR